MNLFITEQLIQAVNCFLQMNRRYCSEEDIAFLKQCMKDLKSIRKAILKNGDENRISARIVEIVKKLDSFFGLADYIKRFFEMP